MKFNMILLIQNEVFSISSYWWFGYISWRSMQRLTSSLSVKLTVSLNRFNMQPGQSLSPIERTSLPLVWLTNAQIALVKVLCARRRSAVPNLSFSTLDRSSKTRDVISTLIILLLNLKLTIALQIFCEIASKLILRCTSSSVYCTKRGKSSRILWLSSSLIYRRDDL